MIVIAHRGESSDAVENSLSAVLLAWSRGVRAVEIDVRLTLDNRIVVLHDSHTGRLSSIKKVVSKTTLEDLKKLSISLDDKKHAANESFATLSEILETVPEGRKLVIEVKSDKRIIPYLVSILNECTLGNDQIEIICFNKRILSNLKAHLPKYKMFWLLDLDYRWPSWLLPIRPSRLAKSVKRSGLDGVDVWAGKFLNEKFVKEFKNLELGVYAWTVNDFEQAVILKEMGIDGLTTDKAAWMHSQFREKQKSKAAVIAIHGLGNKPPKSQLEEWWKQAIKEGFAKHGYIDLDFEFEMVYWADLIYERPLSLDETGEFQLLEDYQPSTGNHQPVDHSLRLKIMSFVEEQISRIFLNRDYSMNYSGLTDGIMKRYFRDFDIYFRQELKDTDISIRELINQRLIDTISKYSNRKILILGHSMGSIIAYDALNNKLKNQTIDTLFTLGSPLGLPMVLHKIALENKTPPEELKGLQSPETIKNEWHNFSDPLDKVAFDYNLADDFIANSHGVKPIDHLVMNDYVKDEVPNPHKSYGYLRAKGLSDVLAKFLST